MAGLIIKIVIIVILVVLSALFSSSETALTTISPHRVRALVDEGNRRAKILDRVLERKDKMLSTILICNNVVNLAASALMTMAVQEAFGNSWVSVGTGVLTLIVLIFGEVAPKTMATLRAEKLALRFCGIINALMIVLTPLVVAISFLSTGVLRILGVKKDEEPAVITEQELRTIVEVSEEEGIIEKEGKDIINNVFDFSDTIAREVMVPRPNVVAVGIDDEYGQLDEIFRKNFYTRLPVFDEDGEKVLGILHMKDFVFYDGDPELFRVKELMRDADFTYENKKLAELFNEMKNGHIAMEIVLDEYGNTAGIITMEDIIEELVGDIRDEYDEEEKNEICKISDNEYLVEGHVSLGDINDAIGTSLESEDYDSIGGLLIEKLGRLPQTGDEAVVEEPFGPYTGQDDDSESEEGDPGGAAANVMRISAELVEGVRIDKIRLTFESAEDDRR